MEKVYKLSQIIFALRQEYQKVQKELETLKKYVVSTDTLDDYYFNLEGNPTRMLLYLETKQRRLEKLFGRDCMVCKDITENVDKKYIRHGKLLCQISYPVELSTEIEKIIYSDFVHNMRNMRAFQHCLEEQKDVICIEPDKIRIESLRQYENGTLNDGEPLAIRISNIPLEWARSDFEQNYILERIKNGVAAGVRVDEVSFVDNSNAVLSVRGLTSATVTYEVKGEE